MTLVLLVSVVVVTFAALRGGGTTALVVCRGSATTAATRGTTTTPVAPEALTPALGALPARLMARPDRLKLVPVFDLWARRCGVPVSLVEATCYWESGWQAEVVSVTGAVGVCQIEPATATTVRGLLSDTRLDPRTPADNIEMSAAYLRWLLDQTGGRQDLALAAYYQGLASVQRHGILAVSRPYVAGITALLHDYSWS
jgi:soluble lytic murein transglycosylase-like protein